MLGGMGDSMDEVMGAKNYKELCAWLPELDPRKPIEEDPLQTSDAEVTLPVFPLGSTVGAVVQARPSFSRHPGFQIFILKRM